MAEENVTFAIVEDERIESMAMEQFIVHSFSNACVIWKKEDGEEALEAVHQAPPDILIVDIEMPLMNGLELCERLYREAFSGVILIHTAYARFGYARKAVSLNVFDYILKPIDDGELYETLSQCIKESKKRKQAAVRWEQMESLATQVRQYALNLLVKHTLDQGQTRRFFETIGWPVEQKLETLVFHIYSRTSFPSGWMKQFAAQEAWMQASGFLTSSDYINSSYLLVLLQPQQRFKADDWPMLAKLYAWLLIRGFPGCSVQISSLCNTTLAIAQECRRNPPPPKTAMEGSSWNCVEGPPRTWKRIRKKEGERYRGLTRSLLRDGQYDRLARQSGRLLKEIVQESSSGAAGEDDFARRQTCQELILYISEGIDDVWPEDSLWDLYRPLFEEHEEPAVFLQRLPERLARLPRPQTGDSFEELLTWMRSAFASEVTLGAAAARLGVDASYFSRLFKKKTGQNFSEYLTRIRMEHAVNCLKENPSLTLEELCLACGFSSKTYFSEVFKKWKGMTITQYIKEQKSEASPFCTPPAGNC